MKIVAYPVNRKAFFLHRKAFRDLAGGNVRPVTVPQAIELSGDAAAVLELVR